MDMDMAKRETERYEHFCDGQWLPAFRGTLNQTDKSDFKASTFPGPVSDKQEEELLALLYSEFGADEDLRIRIVDENHDIIAEYDRKYIWSLLKT